jgi:hypothetical protein
MTGRRLLLALAVATALAPFLLPTATFADAPSLQVSPLQYTGNLTPGKVSSGFVDVANPSDTTINVTSDVQGFRQTAGSGDLQFFSDPDLSAGIVVGLTNFSLGPRQALRDVFSLDPSKLPGGGVYAAIFFRTQAANQTSSSSFVTESANVGTLLILTNGGPGAHHGAITSLHLPFWQFGSGLHNGALAYQNTDHSRVAVGFKPRLSTTVLPWGRATGLTSGLVLPSVTRNFTFSRPGSYLGLLPVTATDADTGSHRTAWVFALTGFYLWLVPLLFVVAVGLIFWRHHHRRSR